MDLNYDPVNFDKVLKSSLAGIHDSDWFGSVKKKLIECDVEKDVSIEITKVRSLLIRPGPWSDECVSRIEASEDKAVTEIDDLERRLQNITNN